MWRASLAQRSSLKFVDDIRSAASPNVEQVWTLQRHAQLFIQVDMIRGLFLLSLGWLQLQPVLLGGFSWYRVFRDLLAGLSLSLLRSPRWLRACSRHKFKCALSPKRMSMLDCVRGIGA